MTLSSPNLYKNGKLFERGIDIDPTWPSHFIFKLVYPAPRNVGVATAIPLNPPATWQVDSSSNGTFFDHRSNNDVVPDGKLVIDIIRLFISRIEPPERFAYRSELRYGILCEGRDPRQKYLFPHSISNFTRLQCLITHLPRRDRPLYSWHKHTCLCPAHHEFSVRKLSPVRIPSYHIRKAKGYPNTAEVKSVGISDRKPLSAPQTVSRSPMRIKPP